MEEGAHLFNVFRYSSCAHKTADTMLGYVRPHLLNALKRFSIDAGEGGTMLQPAVSSPSS